MTDRQYEQFASYAKSDDFLDDNAAHAAITGITQIAPLATDLKTKLAEITTADGLGAQDNTGVSDNKNALRQDLIDKFFVITRAATAYYTSISDSIKQKIVDFNPSDVDKMNAEKLYAVAKKLVTDTTPDAANLIGATATEITALDTAADAFNDVIPDPKRATEVSKVNNARIDPLLGECRELRGKLDIFMQTLISSEPTLYAEWNETLNIDQAATSNPPVLSIDISVASGETQTVNYEEFAMRNNSQIKLINNNDATIDFGFGPDPGSFNGTPTTVGEQSQERKTATALGYQSIENNSLNVQNNAGDTLSVTIEFYEMS